MSAGRFRVQVRTRWQLAQTTSHLAISRRITARLRETMPETPRILAVPGR
jgi:predicted phage tail protein